MSKKKVKDSNLSNLVYGAVSKITEERENNGSYKGNGHHLAQEITEAVCEAVSTEMPIIIKSKKKWYGLMRGKRAHAEILLILDSDHLLTKKDFYDHDVPMNPEKTDRVVELGLFVK
jgi:hypothetical protein